MFSPPTSLPPRAGCCRIVTVTTLVLFTRLDALRLKVLRVSMATLCVGAAWAGGRGRSCCCGCVGGTFAAFVYSFVLWHPIRMCLSFYSRYATPGGLPGADPRTAPEPTAPGKCSLCPVPQPHVTKPALKPTKSSLIFTFIMLQFCSNKHNF